jgi:hypothetical protein
MRSGHSYSLPLINRQQKGARKHIHQFQSPTQNAGRKKIGMSTEVVNRKMFFLCFLEIFALFAVKYRVRDTLLGADSQSTRRGF